jgi:hypothetical protein
MSAALLIGLVMLAVVAWRVLRAAPIAVLAAVAVAGGLVHHGVLAVPEPVREAASSAEAWRDDRIAALRCRAALLAALAAEDEERAVALLEATCGGRRGRELPFEGDAAAHRHVRAGAARAALRGRAPA